MATDIAASRAMTAMYAARVMTAATNTTETGADTFTLTLLNLGTCSGNAAYFLCLFSYIIKLCSIYPLKDLSVFSITIRCDEHYWAPALMIVWIVAQLHM